MSLMIAVAPTKDVPLGEARAYAVGDYEVAVFNVDGTFYAIENACPHQGGPLAEGRLEGAIVTCPWHAWCFDVRDGAMTLGALTAVDTFEVQIEGSTILVADVPRT